MAAESEETQAAPEPARGETALGSRLRRWRPVLVDLVLIIGFVTWFYSPFMQPGLPPGDFSSTVTVMEMEDEILSTPWTTTHWNPLTMCGRPYVGFMSPFKIFQLPFQGLEPITRLKAMLVFWNVLGGLTMYWLLRSTRGCRAAALFAGLVYPIMASHISRTSVHGHVQIPMFFALVPLIFLGMYHLRRGSWRGMLLLGLAIGTAIMRDTERTLLFGVVLGTVLLVPFLYSSALAIARKSEWTTPSILGPAGLTLSFLVATLLNAIDVFPRYLGDPEYGGWEAGEQAYYLKHWALTNLYTVLDANTWLGRTLEGVGLDFYESMSRYIGVSLFALVVVGLGSGSALLGDSVNRRRFFTVAAMFPVALWFAFGTEPIIESARPRWAAVFASSDVSLLLKLGLVLGLILVLAALGRGVYGLLPAGRGRLLGTVLLVSGGCALFLLTAPLPLFQRVLFFLRELRNPDWFQVAVGSFALCYPAALVVAGLADKLKGRPQAPFVLGALVLLCLLDFGQHRHYLSRWSISPERLEQSQAAYASMKDDTPDARVFPVERYSNYTDTGYIWHRRPLAWEFRSQIAPKRLQTFTAQLHERMELNPKSRFIPKLLGLANVRYVVDDVSLPPDITGKTELQIKARKGRTAVYENQDFMPYVVAWPRAHLLVGESTRLGVRLTATMVDLNIGLIHDQEGEHDSLFEDCPVVYLDGEAEADDRMQVAIPLGKGDGIPNPGTHDFDIEPELSWSRPAPDVISVTAHLPSRSLIQVSEAYHPWWTAQIDGKDAEVHPTGYAFLGLMVPPGEHHIEFSFAHPWHYAACGAASLLTLLTLLALLVWSWRKGRGLGEGEPLF